MWLPIHVTCDMIRVNLLFIMDTLKNHWKKYMCGFTFFCWAVSEKIFEGFFIFIFKNLTAKPHDWWCHQFILCGPIYPQMNLKNVHTLSGVVFYVCNFDIIRRGGDWDHIIWEQTEICITPRVQKVWELNSSDGGMGTSEWSFLSFPIGALSRGHCLKYPPKVSLNYIFEYIDQTGTKSFILALWLQRCYS